MIKEGPWNILVVDDDPDIHLSTKFLLKNMVFNETPIEMHFAHSTDEAKSIINTVKDIAVVILDIVMDANDSGIKFANYIREDIKDNTVQIILRTGESANAPPEHVLEKCGVEFYIEKNSQDSLFLKNVVRSSINSYLRKCELKETLTKAKEEAEELAQNRMAFLAYMAHEIRGSLSQFSEGAHHLARTELNDKQKILVGIIKNGGDNVLEFCNDFLDHEKINLGKMNLENIAFDLKKLINEAIESYSIGLPEDKSDRVKVTANTDPSIPDVVVGDAMRIRQIITNLMTNALKFTEEGSVDLSAGLKSASNDLVEILFLIKDTGIGIPADKIDSIFNPYVQAEESTARVFKGTGLGLSICKQFVELMSGEIWVKNNPNRGTCFFFTLKLGRA